MKRVNMYISGRDSNHFEQLLSKPQSQPGIRWVELNIKVFGHVFASSNLYWDQFSDV